MKYKGTIRDPKSDYTFTCFEVEEHKRNDFIGNALALIIGMMLGVFIIFALSYVNQIMV